MNPIRPSHGVQEQLAAYEYVKLDLQLAVLDEPAWKSPRRD
jgi:hypothetical protein